MRIRRMLCGYTNKSSVVLVTIFTLAAIIVFLYTFKIEYHTHVFPDENILRRQFEQLQIVHKMKASPADKTASHEKKNSKQQAGQQQQTFVIYDWSYYNRYTRKGSDYLVDNCVVRRTADYISDGDVIVVAVGYDHATFPPKRSRNPRQRWVFLFDDTFANFEPMKCLKASNYNKVFNWTMTYRQDSDVIIPYGVTIPLETPDQRGDVNFASKRSALVFAMISNCPVYFNNRLEYISQLQQFIQVDFYGACGTLQCAGHLREVQLCDEVKKYKFFLAFENTNCKDYITEKFWRMLNHSIVPIVMGASKPDYLKLAPPGSFIHVNDFESVEKLAKYLKYLDENDNVYNTYLEWTKYYRVQYRVQFLHNVIWKALCDKLNEDNQVKVYEDFEKWVDIENTCPNAVDRYRCGQ